MKVIDIKSTNNWQEIKNACMATIGKDSGKEPDSDWKKRILLAEHSPIRLLKISWKWVDLPYFVSVHFTRHNNGIYHFVSSQRPNPDRGNDPQDAPVTHVCSANAQALINISRKRLCNKAAKETREAWQMVKDEVAKVEPELASCMVRECVYRRFCPEMKGCGFFGTKEYIKEMRNYLK